MDNTRSRDEAVQDNEAPAKGAAAVSLFGGLVAHGDEL